MKRIISVILILTILLISIFSTVSCNIFTPDTDNNQSVGGDNQNGGQNTEGEESGGNGQQGNKPEDNNPEDNNPEDNNPEDNNPEDNNPEDNKPEDDNKEDEHSCDKTGHTDSNADDYCDECNTYVAVIIDFYVINDLHGKFCDTDSQGGVDELATYLKNARETDDNSIFLATGDMWQGTAESNLTRGNILTEWMNELDFTAMTMGNHDFDWGVEAIKNNADMAEFPFLAINVYDLSTGRLADYCTPSVMVECDGIQVGIIGAIGDCYSSISSDKVKNVEFKVGDELAALVEAEADRLRAEGADLIVYSLHDGHGKSSSGKKTISNSDLKKYYTPSLSNGVVDIVFEAHTHQNYTLVDSYGVYHIQAGGENKGISHVELSVNTVNGNNKVRVADYVRSTMYTSLEDDPSTEALEEKYADIIEMSYSTLGTVSRYYDDDVLENKVAELYLEYGLEEWGKQYNIVLGGGFLRTRSPYNLSSGNTTYADILSLLPFDNDIVLCSVKGYKLKSQFVQTSNGDYHIAYSDYGEDLIEQISDYETYYIVVDTYTALYSYNGLTIVDYLDSGLYARDLVAEAIRNGEL